MGKFEGTGPVKIRAKAKSPEGAQLGTTRLKDVADTSSSGEQARKVPQPDAEVKGVAEGKRKFRGQAL